MKRAKKLLASLLVVAMVAAMPMSAFAKKAKGAVPTAGTRYSISKDGTQTAVGSFTASFDKKGRIRSYTYTTASSSPSTKTIAYNWKNDYLKSVTTVIDTSSSTNRTTTTYTYKKGLLKSIRTTSNYTPKYSGGTPSSSSSTTTYKWNNREALIKYTNNNSGSRSCSSITVNKKKQRSLVWDSNTKYNYNKNKMVSKITSSSRGSESSSSSTETFSKFGYPVTYSYTDADKDSTYNSNTSYAFSMSGAKPLEVTVSNTYGRTYPTDPSENYSGSSTYKIVYTAWTNVKQIRNCDKFGLMVWLGIGEESAYNYDYDD